MNNNIIDVCWLQNKNTKRDICNNGKIIKPIVFLPAPKCYCKVQNGDLENNGILCSENKTRTCGIDEWCTGPATEDSAVTFLGAEKFCSKGRIK